MSTHVKENVAMNRSWSETEFPRPKIVVSKCLGFDPCRFNGEILKDRFVTKLKGYVDFIPVCPEVEIGLGTPRAAVRLVASSKGLRLVQPSTGADLSDSMRHFSAEFLDSLKEVDGFILTHRSPSCAIGDAKYYPASEKGGVEGKAAGFFGDAVLKRYPLLAIEDDGRLLNLPIREHFLTRIFAFARLRNLQNHFSMSALVRFHAGHKFLLQVYNENRMRELGRLVANRERESSRRVLDLYAKAFQEAFERVPRTTAQINVLMHALGHFSKGLSPEEKCHFLGVLEIYREGRVPLQSVTNVLWSWALRFDSKYLQGQVFFRPFPENLLAVENSGKGRNLSDKPAA